MSMTENKRELIKRYILESLFLRNESGIVRKAADNFSISQQTVYKYIRELISDGKIEKVGREKYNVIQTVKKVFTYNLLDRHLEEDKIFGETLNYFVDKYSQNVYRIWQYAFTEIVNNVIDHSNASEMKIMIGQNALYTWVNIYDNGIGIFKKIADFYKYSSLDEAIVSLFKGKLTTDKENHSGEGIFFTSHVMDHFGVISDNKIFTRNNTISEIKDFDIYKDKKGTLVTMSLTNNVNRTLKEVFDMYSSVDGGFTITSIPMKRICDSGCPISRSQAKRLYYGFDKFEKVILDFADVDEIGQGFAHELFNVFERKHPEISIECRNTNETIDKMIKRVKME